METREEQIARESARLRRFQSLADDIARAIVGSDLPWVDIAMQIERLRAEAERLFPQRMELFDMVYVHRFRRLWEQWRVAWPETRRPS